MQDYYFWIIVLLFVLAISDLIVGVSNDAVNFLNSAVGSQVATRKLIMIIASLGILLGSTFSSGMIEVARKGIFNPEYFFFTEIMVIFLAVMITDIILLDLFNTFGMPTSTTVSIVFELLGAAVIVALLKLNLDPVSAHSLGDFINGKSALIIISGIFISVFIAFFSGTMVQFVSRLLFTFQVKKRFVWVAPFWSGLALTALTFFLLIKGMKGASFLSDDFVQWTQDSRLILALVSLVFWFVVMQICVSVFKLNILRFVVLFGTFSLAMAFAGNDLVNFIGVPVAGLESYLSWSQSGVSADSYTMSILNQPVKTETYLLAGAGLVMVVTLWVSKKSRSVTETEVNLGRQDEGSERFSPNALSKGIVRLSIPLGQMLQKVVPASWARKAEESFAPYLEPVPKSGIYQPPAFDLVRASVNLTVASVLIAIATSLKLPLSTTYVSFMVAMGASLADKAWGRESAVYRVAGVLNVIGGWLLTAIIAFTASAVFASIIYFFKGWGVIALVMFILFMQYKTFLSHKNKSIKQSLLQSLENQTQAIDTKKIITETQDKVLETLELLNSTYSNTIQSFDLEDRKSLKSSKKAIQGLLEKNQHLQNALFKVIKKTEQQHTHSSRVYLLVYDLEQDVVQSMSLIADSCYDYIDNSFKPFKESEIQYLRSLSQLTSSYLDALIESIRELKLNKVSDLIETKTSLYNQLEAMLSELILAIQQGNLGRRKSRLLFDVILETKNIVAITTRFLKLYERVDSIEVQKDLALISGMELEPIRASKD